MSLFSSNKRKGTAQGVASIDDLSSRRAPTDVQKIRTGCPPTAADAISPRTRKDTAQDAASIDGLSSRRAPAGG